MKFNYLFVNYHNGHETTYHPFCSNTFLTQEKITRWLMQIPGATRIGTNLYDLLSRLEKENIEFEEFGCPCCGTIINTISGDKSTCSTEWIKLNCVDGNY